MSRRFGRNQRRRAREALAQAQELAQRMTLANAYSQALARSLGEDNRALKAAMNEALESAHRLSVLFPAQQELMPGMPAPGRGERLRLHVPRNVSSYRAPLSATMPAEDFASRFTVELETLATQVREDAMANAVHADVQFADGAWRYSMSRTSIAAMSRERFERDMTISIARQFARQIADYFKPKSKR